jgi:sugar-specific transcriptional regulator TrmB
MHKVHSSTALRVKIANVIEGTQKEVMATTTTQAEVQTRLSTPDLFEMIVNTLRTNVSADAAVSAGQ